MLNAVQVESLENSRLINFGEKTMSARKRFLALILIVPTGSMIVLGIAIYLLYSVAID